MEKKEFQKIVRTRLKKEGFMVKGNYAHKILDDDYLIGVEMDHHPFCKGYFIYYGVIYLPDDIKFPPFKGFFDWRNRFDFTKDPKDDLNNYPLEEHINGFIDYDEDSLERYFEYDIRTGEDLAIQLDINIKKKLSSVYDKEFALNIYRDNTDSLARLPELTVAKILDLYDIDRDKINSYRKSKGFTKYDF
ncbi:MAG: hypothetical protein IJC13_06655 [Clostridia bacterium]|nr:hypothetical protein [Clostridia bacterium]